MAMTIGTTLPAVTGGCLCGRVRYRATPDHREGYYCHCRMCQLGVGNTRAAFINLPQAVVEWSGEPRTLYASSSFGRRGFCARCGTPLSFEYVESKNIDLTVGSLDDPDAFKPVSHFAVETRIAGWHVPDGLEENRLDQATGILDRWKKAYGDDVVPGVDATRQA